MTFIRLLLFILIFYLIFRFISRMLFPFLYHNKSDLNWQDKTRRKNEGEVTIDFTDKKGSKKERDENGEYVDFEEVE